MIRFLVTYDQPADPEAFDRRYRTAHEPLMRRLTGLLTNACTGSRAPYGARPTRIVELTWPDWETAYAAFASDEPGDASPAPQPAVPSP